MIIYTKEKGNSEKYKLNVLENTVEFPKGDNIVSASIVVFTDIDEKQIVNRYNDYRRIYNSELVPMYKKENFEGIRYYISHVLNNRNFILSITNKTYILAKILYFTLMTRASYSNKPGYALSFISDLAKLKDDLTYPLLTTCEKMDEECFKELLKIVLDCPYYLTDFHNILKRDTENLYWSCEFEKYMSELDKYNLNDPYYCDQYLTGFDFANIVERFTSGLRNSSISEVKFIRDNEYKYSTEVMFHLSFSKVNIEYQDKKEHTFLRLLDDLSEFFLMLLNDCLEIVYTNGNYDNERFNILSLIFKTIYQENIEFQIPASTWATLIGITDLCNDNVSSFYKSNEIVDNVILTQYTRVNEYFKNHAEDKRAFSVFKTRV